MSDYIFSFNFELLIFFFSNICQFNFDIRFLRKREIESENFGPLFEAMYQADTTDCTKLLVCHVFEKPEEKLTGLELKVNRLFADDLSVIDPTTVKAEYQLAAYVGTFNQTGLCARRYSRCTTSLEDLTELLQHS